MGRYSKEYYKQNKERILSYQRKWKSSNKEKINVYRLAARKKMVELRSASMEDIERNIKLYQQGLDLDLPMRKLGPLFKQKLAGIERPKVKVEPHQIICKECKHIFMGNKRVYCSDKCSGEYWKRYGRKYQQRRKRIDSVYAIEIRLRDRLRESIRFYNKTNKVRQSKDYLNFAEIIKHLGPCPGNRKDYHIDHIVPLCKFDFTKEEEIKKAFSPENHQWLPVKENLKKGKE